MPEAQIAGVLRWLVERGYDDVRDVGSVEEHQVFAMPLELRRPTLRPRPPTNVVGQLAPDSGV